MEHEKGTTYDDVVQQILEASKGPVAVEKMIDEIIARKATISKNPRLLVKNKLRNYDGRLLIYLDSDQVMAVPLAYNGARFRIRLNQEAINREAIPVDNFDHFLSHSVDIDNMILKDRAGIPIPFEIKRTTREEKSLFFGPFIIENRWIALKEWFQQQNMGPKDHLLVTIEDWEQGIVCLEREPLEKQRSKQINERNQVVANILYNMLDNARDESIQVYKAIPTLYALLPDKADSPPDHWLFIIRQDARMKTDTLKIHYAENNTFWGSFSDIMFQHEISPKAKPVIKSVNKAQKEIYLFRAALKGQPSTWRDIEILGSQTLFDLDKELRNTFQYDPFDHLSGFWKLIARGNGEQKRYREVEIGTIIPFERGEAANMKIASLGLQVGDMLNYIFDFGASIKHTLTLKALGNPQPDVKYPREVPRN